MNTDSPIESTEADDFNYSPIAQNLAPHLLLEKEQSSLVVGLEGPWGSGKTSFLNLVRLALTHPGTSATILQYRPWVYSTVDSLILGFCAQLASQLSISPETDYKRIAEAFVGFSHALTPLRWLPGAEPFVTVAQKGMETISHVSRSAATLEEMDISNAKARVQKAINSVQDSIIIVIDDCDRLAPQEIRQLFQFIKAVADFKGVTYLIAYDPLPIEKALSYDDTLDGREYLKKFIQLPVRLPRISKILFRNYVRLSIERLGEGAAVERSQLSELIETALSDEILACLKTPRDVIRCLNIFALRLPEFQGEVALTDLLKFVVLELIQPDVIEFVRNNSGLFLKGLTHHPEFISTSDSFVASMLGHTGDVEAQREQFLETVPCSRRTVVRALLKSLFDQVRFSTEIDARSAGSPHALVKLLYGGSTRLAFSVRSAQAFFEGETRERILQEQVSMGTLREWIYFLSGLKKGSEIVDPCDLADLLIGAADKAEDDKSNLVTIHELVGEYFQEVLYTIAEIEQMDVFVRSIIAHGEALDVSHRLVLAVARDAGLWKSGTSVPKESAYARADDAPDIPLDTIIGWKRNWCVAVSAAAEGNTLHLQRSLFSILHRWGQFSDNDYTQPRQYIERFCESNDPIELLKYSGIGIDVSGLDKLLANPSKILVELNRYKDSEFRERAKRYLHMLIDKSNSPTNE